jgi:PLP dependent protein
MPSDLEQNLFDVQARIRAAAKKAGRDPDDVTLVAVGKTFPAEVLLEACQLGIRHLGENRVEEAATKIPRVNSLAPGRVTWHMIGHVQHRKAKDTVALFDLVQSVDSVQTARYLESRASAENKIVPVLLEVNVSQEPSKYGFSPEPRASLFAAIREIAELEHLDVQGLMTVAPIVGNPEEARPFFRALRDLRDELRVRFSQRSWPHLSMGMTGDYEAAILEGATMVRIGRAIFGARPHL